MLKRLGISLVSISVIFSLMMPMQGMALDNTTTLVASQKAAEETAKISKDKATQIAVDFIQKYTIHNFEPKDYDTRIELRPDRAYSSTGVSKKDYVWECNFNTSSYDSYEAMSLSVNATTGIVQNYYKYGNKRAPNDKIQLATITDTQAKEIAQKFLSKVHPKEAPSLCPDENTIYHNTEAYTYKYIRKVNGIPFNDNFIEISVNNQTGDILNYSYVWDTDITFPSATGIISKEEAKKIMHDNISFDLVYASSSNSLPTSKQTSTFTLVYQPNSDSGSVVNAKTGNIINNLQLNVVEEKELSDAEKKDFIAKWKPAAKFDKELDNKQAEEIMAKYVSGFLGSDYEISSIRYMDTEAGYAKEPDQKIWSAQFQKKNNQTSYDGGNISIDASTGDITEFYRSIEPSQNIESKISWSEAYNKAIKTVSELLPHTVKNIKTAQKLFNYNDIVGEYAQPVYDFNFVETMHGIECPSKGIYISINKVTGEVENLSSSYSDIELPKPEKIISQEMAKDAYTQTYAADLAYIFSNGTGTESSKKIELAYIPKSLTKALASAIDAKTGKPIVLYGNDNEEMDTFKKKIEGNWAEKELQLLAYQGILDIKKFSPGKKITTLDALKLLVNAKNISSHFYSEKLDSLKFKNIDPDNEDYKTLQMAVQYGILENTNTDFQFDQKLSREDMAVLLIKLLKFDKIAESKNIFSLKYHDAKDISKDKYGYVALGTGLNIFVGSNNNFRPKDNVTIEEMAVVSYKAMTCLNENKDKSEDDKKDEPKKIIQKNKK